MSNYSSPITQTVLITGAARRIGAAIARYLHNRMNIILHYHTSAKAARELQTELEIKRPDSVHLMQADLANISTFESLINQAAEVWGGIDVLINNASSFYPTPLGKVTESEWNDLFDSNVKGPFFLTQAVLPWLKASKGSLINIADIHAERPLKGYPVYCMAKAAVVMMTQSLARELAPQIRVNAIAPGAIIWPEDADEEKQQHILSLIPLATHGQPENIAHTVEYLIDNTYITGQIIAVDGGRSIRS